MLSRRLPLLTAALAAAVLLATNAANGFAQTPTSPTPATVTDAAAASIAMAGPQTVPTDPGVLDNVMTLTTSPQPSASLVAGYHVSITGP